VDPGSTDPDGDLHAHADASASDLDPDGDLHAHTDADADGHAERACDARRATGRVGI
jgi:hypothetical protein